MELTVQLLRETARSYVVKETEDGPDITLPISQTTIINTKKKDGNTYIEIDIPDWLAEDRGLL